jgi:hypothetical protein
MNVGSYGYVPSCQAPKATASQGPEQAMLIRCGKPSGTHDWGPGSLPWVDKRVGRGRQVVKSRLPALIIGWRSDGHRSFPRLVLFRLVVPPIQPGVVRLFPSMECMVPQPFAVGGNRSYTEFWAISGNRWYPGYLPRQERSVLPLFEQRATATTDLYLSYPVFMPKPCTHRMHDPGSIVPDIQHKRVHR